MKNYIITVFITETQAVLNGLKSVKEFDSKSKYFAIDTFETDEIPSKGDCLYVNKKIFVNVDKRIRFDTDPISTGHIPVAILCHIDIDNDSDFEIIKKLII